MLRRRENARTITTAESLLDVLRRMQGAVPPPDEDAVPDEEAPPSFDPPPSWKLPDRIRRTLLLSISQGNVDAIDDLIDGKLDDAIASAEEHRKHLTSEYRKLSDEEKTALRDAVLNDNHMIMNALAAGHFRIAVARAVSLKRRGRLSSLSTSSLPEIERPSGSLK